MDYKEQSTNEEQPLIEDSGLFIESHLLIIDEESKEQLVNMRA
jgi:hypothetical protein